MEEEPGNHRSSRLSQIVFEGVEEIGGRSGVHAVLNTSLMAHFYQWQPERAEKDDPLPALEVSAIQSSLEEVYGKRGGRGIALRAGRASFKYVLRTYGASLGLTDLNYRLLPAPIRLRTGLEALVRLFSDLEGGPVAIEQTEAAWLWRSTACPYCWQRQTSEPACTFTIGLLQEFMAWNSGGKVFQIEETECRANGNPACVFRIDIQPLE
jgi:predicted hydrocarbon binding protein